MKSSKALLSTSLFAGLFWHMNYCDGFQARETSHPRIQGRTSPSVTPITVAPQTVKANGSFSTVYLSYSVVTQNSAATEVIDGTTTILPLWYCDPNLSAPACEDCPSTTASADSSCPTDFNMILLLPAVAVVGAFIPPPDGLPTITIGSDGVATPETTPSPTEISPSMLPSDTSEPLITIVPPCTVPPMKASNVALSIIPTPSVWIPPTGSYAPAPTDALPVLPVTVNEAAPTAWLGCGAGVANPYSPGGFYQFSDSFSRNDGLYAIDAFCNEQIAANLLISPSGETVSGMPKPAISAFSKTYLTPGGSGKVIVVIDSDVDNKNTAGQTCPDKWTYSFAQYAQCRQYFGQTIDYCDTGTTLANSDITW
ncbi:uncharacterized protein LY89DRAFT_738321 [Mollisia scopiformis]|uniref:Uncharacterized protein n=1 Tax=Mollisia scopiformis TaxID=149040 RepID=A0A194WX93_MOLSC|nr:uncharacterized protein LY89DRAFT_738321 [Mollisia scopiformis]KUJ12545.1 hypothetical protein LY89DRAFT_738321 [Mollisia scopiformis]